VPASLQDRRAGDVASMVRSVEITSAPAGATGDADPHGDASGEPVASRYWGIAVVVGVLVLVALVLVLRRRKR